MFSVGALSRQLRTIVGFLVIGFVLNLFYTVEAEAARRRAFGRGAGFKQVRGGRQVVRVSPRRVSRIPRGFARNRRFGLNNRFLANAPLVNVPNNNNVNNNDLDIFGTGVAGNNFFGFNSGIGNSALLAQQLASQSLFTPTFARDQFGNVVELNPTFLGRSGNPVIDPSLLGAAAANNGILPASMFPGGVIPQEAIRQNVVIGTGGQILFGQQQQLLPQSQQNAVLINQGGVQSVQPAGVAALPGQVISIGR